MLFGVGLLLQADTIAALASAHYCLPANGPRSTHKPWGEPFLIVDLHTHTTASDGSLSPAELVERARGRGVELLAITDHDTLAAYADLAEAAGAPGQPMKMVAGVELSCTWNGITIHVLGLGVDLASEVINRSVDSQRLARQSRAEEIGRRLEKKGLPGVYQRVASAVEGRAIGRPDFAKAMVKLGMVTSVADAFDRYLGSGKIGDVKAMWPAMADVVSWIVEAGGAAVLAHPTQYKMTNAKLRRFLGEFVDAGGEGLEVCNGRPPEVEIRYLRELCREFDLAASAGSDFHQPNPWCDLGCDSSVIGQCRPVWQRWLPVSGEPSGASAQ